MGFSLGWELPPPYDQVFADLLESPRGEYIRKQLCDFAGELITQELVNEATKAALPRKLNMQVTHESIKQTPAKDKNTFNNNETTEGDW